ncbi:hypothetical protein C8R46DRAFT_1049504 [Mycena filopes]|nr:hypothetical protein C8R46DRAFT_1049504 [Mycena filopes]
MTSRRTSTYVSSSTSPFSVLASLSSPIPRATTGPTIISSTTLVLSLPSLSSINSPSNLPPALEQRPRWRVQINVNQSQPQAIVKLPVLDEPLFKFQDTKTSSKTPVGNWSRFNTPQVLAVQDAVETGQDAATPRAFMSQSARKLDCKVKLQQVQSHVKSYLSGVQDSRTQDARRLKPQDSVPQCEIAQVLKAHQVVRLGVGSRTQWETAQERKLLQNSRSEWESQDQRPPVAFQGSRFGLKNQRETAWTLKPRKDPRPQVVLKVKNQGAVQNLGEKLLKIQELKTTCTSRFTNQESAQDLGGKTALNFF